MKKLKKKGLVTMLVVVLLFPLHAVNQNNFSFTHLGIQEGISGQRVYSIHQSQEGALWWTTRYGVDRWNGYQVKNYYLDNRELYSAFAGHTTLFAKQLEGDSSRLYVFDNTGRIFYYNVSHDGFEEMIHLSRLMGSDIVLNDVVVSPQGMWLAMREGLYFLHDGTLEPLYADQHVNCLFPLHKQEMLVGTPGGVLHLNYSDTIVSAQHVQVEKWLPYNVESGYYDAIEQKMWLGTFTEGVKCVALDGEKPQVLPVDYHLPGNPVRSVVPYDPHTLLVGIDGFGVYQIDRGGGTASLLFDANGGPSGVLHGNGVYDILVDSWQNIVVGTYSGGIDIARPLGSISAFFKHVQNNTDCLVNAHVNSVSGSKPGYLIMGTDDGVSLYNLANGTWSHQGKGMVVLDICCQQECSLLLATYGNGVCRIDGNRCQTIYSTEEGTLRDDHVYKVRYDSRGNLWMGCLSGALVVKMADGAVRYFDVDNVFSLLELADGRMSVGTSHGLYLIDLDRSEVKHLDYRPAGAPDYNQFVLALYADANQRLWIGTDGGGLYLYDFRTGQGEQITVRQGLPSNSVTSIVADDRGRLWLGTERGLAYIDPDHLTEVIDVNFNYGLNTEYISGAACLLPNGEILYGTADAAILINTHSIQQIDYQARLNISGAKIYEERKQTEAELDLQKEQCYRALQEGQLHLRYTQNTFDICFECINLRFCYDIAYQHRLEDSEWSAPSNQQVLSFVNLEPGTHQLSIRSVSRTSGQVLDERSLAIIIDRPWWSSGWMWCVYVLLLMLAFYLAWRVYDLHSRYMRLVVNNLGTNAPMEGVPSGNCASTETADPAEGGEAQEEVVEANNEFVDAATRVILENLHDVDFTIDDLCKELAMSRTLFYVKLKTYTGKSPQDFVRVIRLERSAALLRQGCSVADVAVKVGFDNPKYFGVVFKKYFGISPSKYK